jgi:hypothetical protein
MGWKSYNIDSTGFVTHQYELEEEMSFVPSSRPRTPLLSQDEKVAAARLRATNCYGHINFRTATSVD